MQPPKELNFKKEAANAEAARAAFHHRLDIVIPRIYPGLSKERVLVLS